MSKVELPGLASSRKAAASTCKMGKNQNSVMMFRIRLILVDDGYGHNRPKFGGQEKVADPGVKIKNSQKKAFFWTVWVPSMCIGTNLDDEQIF